ncbi:MAG: hypothetical protein K2G63_05620 [Oscillospiraceae bacterium]|nr:hypothetical protein [Oscillospiraceae bacterium]
MKDSIYKCPCCGEKTFTPLTKALAGQLNSKGRPCPKCGERIANGKGATIFNAVFCFAMFAFIVYAFLNTLDLWIIPALLAIIFVPRIVNAFFFKLDVSQRKNGF